MNPDDPLNNPAWRHLLSRAHADTPPEIDGAALLRAVRTAAQTPTTWYAELAGLLDLRGALPACLSALCLLAAFSCWQAWDAWEHVVPWAQLILAQVSPVLAGTS